jgi:hypothetical protein
MFCPGKSGRNISGWMAPASPNSGCGRRNPALSRPNELKPVYQKVTAHYKKLREISGGFDNMRRE